MELNASHSKDSHGVRSFIERAPALSVTALVFVFALFLFSASSAEEKIDDGRLNNAIISELSFSEEVSSHLIDVNTIDGVVTLSGEVPDEDALLLAEQLTAELRGVALVKNELQVEQ